MKTAIENREKMFRELATSKSWKNIGQSPRFGVMVPLPYLRSKRNMGVGDFADLVPFARFCRKMGSSIIQILPINDMGRGKVPYNAISAFALDPIFIALDKIREVEKGDLSEELIDYIKANREKTAKLKQAPLIDFDAIRKYKIGFLRFLYDEFRDRNHKDPDRKSFENFKEENRYWLADYSLFRFLKEQSDWKSWEEWPKEVKSHSDKTLKKILEENSAEIDFYGYMQWIAFGQMESAHRELREMGVFLKGDIPILVDYQSADVWAHSDYFKLNVCAGAPPDQYSTMGQNWGMPTYDWENLKKDDYLWWKERLKTAGRFLDIFRIDHIVGIFRIWTIPITGEFPRGKPAGHNGAFDPPELSAEDIKKLQDEKEPDKKSENEPAKKSKDLNINPVWEEQGKSILEMMLSVTDMLPIGEDLGCIPPECTHTMEEMGIPGYKVIIWERDWADKKNGQPFKPVEDYPFISMATTTTHDFWTLSGWWNNAPEDNTLREKDNKDKQALWDFLGLKGERRSDYTDRLHVALLSRVLGSGSIFVILPFQDLWGTVHGFFGTNPLKERINDPSDPGRETNWTGKMPLEIENLAIHPVMMAKISTITKLVKDSNRFIL